MESPEVTMMSRADFEKLLSESDDAGHLDSFQLDLLEEHEVSVPVVKDLDAEILKAIERGGKLEMHTWHGRLCPGFHGESRLRAEVCGTTHCRAGWAIHLAGEAGIALELIMGPEAAGECIYLASTGCVPDFYADDDEAMKDIKRCAGEVA